MPGFQLTLPFKWLCKALSRFPAHIRSRAGSVSLQNKHMGCKSCDSEDSPAIFLSAVAIGNRALQNTIYPGMQGDTELSKGTPVNPFLAKKSLWWSQQKLLLAFLRVDSHINKPAPYKLRQTTETLAQAPGICTSTLRVSSHAPRVELTLNMAGCYVCTTADSRGLCAARCSLPWAPGNGINSSRGSR